MSTVDVETTTKIGAAILGAGGRFLEAPVSGSKGPAEQGALVILAAGEEALCTQCKPGFDAMGKVRYGPYGRRVARLCASQSPGGDASDTSRRHRLRRRRGRSQTSCGTHRDDRTVMTAP